MHAFAKTFWWVLVLLIAFPPASTASAQEKPAEVAPQDFEILVPVGASPNPGRGRNVFLDDYHGRTAVGRVHVEIGDRYMVILPDGRMRSILKRDVSVTERPFEPASNDEIAAHLLADKRFADFKSRTTEHYVYVFNTSNQYCETNGTILESIFPALIKYFADHGIKTHDPLTPLVVIMFGTEEEFQKFRPMPDGIVGYYDPVSNRVVMYEQSKLAETAPVLAIKQCISTVVHEGVHQILHNIGVQPRMSEWPKWLSEGLAEYCSPTRTGGDEIRWEGVGEVHHLRMHALLKRLEKQDERFDDGQLVRDIVAAKDLDSDGYAAAWALTYYLINNHTEAYFAHLRDVKRQYGPFALSPPNNSKIFARHFGDDWPALQDTMIGSAKKLPYVDPVLNQPHYLAVVETRFWRKVLVTTSPGSVHEWKEQVMEDLPRDSTRFTVKVLPNKQEAEAAAGRLLR